VHENIARETKLEIGGENVSFSYSGKEFVIRDINIRLRRGEKLALVGPSGSGKSTFAKVFAGLYEINVGHVYLSSGGIRHFGSDCLRSAISFVPQNPIVFEGTIRENLRLANPLVTETEISRFAHVSCFDEVVCKFAFGWDHKIGPGGSGLSDGEKQRLALLRALLQDRPILILDEATSALDHATEAKLLSRLFGHIPDKTVLFISHNPGVFAWTGRRAVMKDGRILEQEVSANTEVFNPRNI
jgi:ABC-type multidrug transport system fused ATPase/permease subunit